MKKSVVNFFSNLKRVIKCNKIEFISVYSVDIIKIVMLLYDYGFIQSYNVEFFKEKKKIGGFINIKLKCINNKLFLNNICIYKSFKSYNLIKLKYIFLLFKKNKQYNNSLLLFNTNRGIKTLNQCFVEKLNGFLFCRIN